MKRMRLDQPIEAFHFTQLSFLFVFAVHDNNVNNCIILDVSL